MLLLRLGWRGCELRRPLLHYGYASLCAPVVACGKEGRAQGQEHAMMHMAR